MKGNFKFLLVLTILLLGCVCVGSTFAADVSVSNVDDTIDLGIADVSSQNDIGVNYLSSEQVGNFAELNKTINDEISAGNKYITLNKSYKFDDGDAFIEGIVIDEPNLVIDGNGITIDGSNLAKAFFVSDINVTIKNINFINTYALYHGGAIEWYGSYGTLIACNFTNSAVDCTEPYDGGGAIEWDADNGLIMDCNFRDCYCTYADVGSGGAIHVYMSNNITVTNCNFTNTGAEGIGGAICWDQSDYGSVIGCNFENCKCPEDEASAGGAIFWEFGYNGKVIDCNFYNCSADIAGAIDWYFCNDSSIENCNFVDCYASYDSGGAILFVGEDSYINNCTFTNCSSAVSGGAIKLAVYNELVNGCTFTNCNAIVGGAIYSLSTVDSTVSDCTFTNCSSIEWGGVIATEEDCFNYNIINCSFTNSHSHYGGTIYLIASEIIINNCSFCNSSADYGSFIFADFDSALGIYDCDFTLDESDNIAHIYNKGYILSDVVVTTLNEDVKDVTYGESIDLTGTVTTCGLSVAGQKLTFKVNGNQIDAESDNYGNYSARYTVDFVGEQNVDATYNGTFDLETVNMGKLISSKVDVIVTVDDVKGKVGEKVKFIAKVNDVNGNPVQGGVVIFGFNGKEYKANVKNGIATVEVILPKVGNYSATAYYVADENHNDNSVVFDVEVIDDSNPGIPMEHTGSPLVALLIALISLPILRRK